MKLPAAPLCGDGVVRGGQRDGRFCFDRQVGQHKKEWLATILNPSAGVPSHDRFNVFLGAINPPEFEKCLLSWITALHDIPGGQVVAVDGKTLRRSFEATSSKVAIHMASTWAAANPISLGQVVTDEKSNGITAISKLLEVITIKGCLVTIAAWAASGRSPKREFINKRTRPGGEEKPAESAPSNSRLLFRASERRL